MTTDRITSRANVSRAARFATRLFVAGLAVWVVSVVYRTGSVWLAAVLGVLFGVYAIASVARDFRFGYHPWDPIEWQPVDRGDLGPVERRRATRWTIGLKSLLTVASVAALAAVFAAGVDKLGFVFLFGGGPALALDLYRHLENGTRPWQPSVPTRRPRDGS